MTREERNTKLKYFITCLKCEVSGKECDDNCPVQYEAGNMGEVIENLEAISKALEQEPCEDAISRRAVEKITWEEPSYSDALNVLTEVRDKVRALPPVNPQPCPNAISRQAVIDALTKTSGIRGDALKALYDLPSVTPAEKVGHWITTRTFMHDGEYYCDKCKCDSPNNEKWDYCPNCGAKMIEPQESEGVKE